jgi:hypothetical protein
VADQLLIVMGYIVIVAGLKAVGENVLTGMDSQSHQPSFASRVGIGMQGLGDSGGDDALSPH